MASGYMYCSFDADGHIFSVYSVVLLFSRGILGICI